MQITDWFRTLSRLKMKENNRFAAVRNEHSLWYTYVRYCWIRNRMILVLLLLRQLSLASAKTTICQRITSVVSSAQVSYAGRNRLIFYVGKLDFGLALSASIDITFSSVIWINDQRAKPTSIVTRSLACIFRYPRNKTFIPQSAREIVSKIESRTFIRVHTSSYFIISIEHSILLSCKGIFYLVYINI